MLIPSCPYCRWVRTVAAARGKTEQEVKDLLEAGVYDNTQLLAGGWLDGLKYEDEVIEDLKKRTAPGSPLDKPLRKVTCHGRLSACLLGWTAFPCPLH